MKLEGWMLEWHLERKHGITKYADEEQAKHWHEVDHRFGGARHKHEEARGR